MSARDKIAEIIWGHESGNVECCIDAADAILAALPDMIAPLVWIGVEDDCFVECYNLGTTYELQVCDTLERSCDYYWQASALTDFNQAVSVNTPPQATYSQAQAAANAHHRAAIMAALNGEAKP
jgi:hypothetical protein